MEDFLRDVNVRHSFSELTLFRGEKGSDDELDHLVSAYNSMVGDLRQAYNDMRVVNDQLKKDIVARKSAEAKVKLLNEELESRVEVRTAELEAANKELNAFCYSVSHDLRAPLRRVNGFRHNINMEFADKLGTRGMHYLSRMESCTNEMNSMIDSFLILAKSTNTELVIEEVNLSAIVNRILVVLKERDKARVVKIRIQPNVKAICDARLVELLLNNLLDNAWKYSAKQEHVEIVFARKKLNGERFYVIEDNGAGFDMAYADNLFTPFTRLHKLSDFRGIGIGLATVKRVAARHGGRVWAESTVGKGAKFFFTLKGKGALEFDEND
jgi:light-regulated signal transduction histidine kinase (bacteriophytochrome)